MPDQDVPYPGWPQFEYVCDSANSGSHGPAFCGLGPGPDCPWCQRRVVMTPEWEAFIQDTPNRHRRMAESLLGNPEVKASLRRHSRYNRGESQDRMMAATDTVEDDIKTLLTNIKKNHDEMTSFDIQIEAITKKIVDDLERDAARKAAITKTGQREVRRMQRQVFWHFVRSTIKDTIREYFSPITRWFGRKR